MNCYYNCFVTYIIVLYMFNLIVCDEGRVNKNSTTNISISSHLSQKSHQLCNKIALSSRHRSKRNKEKFYTISHLTNTATHNSKGFLSDEYNEDEIQLKKRKLWSRWSKWGSCSVTCGEGTITRHRLCVSGRCAPGEFEEQRRPCSRPPCMLFSEMNDEHD